MMETVKPPHKAEIIQCGWCGRLGVTTRKFFLVNLRDWRDWLSTDIEHECRNDWPILPWPPRKQ